MEHPTDLNEELSAPPALTASHDQLSAILGSLSGVVGSYYSHLKKAGIPSALAHDLARDWHYLHCASWMDTDLDEEDGKTDFPGIR